MKISYVSDLHADFYIPQLNREVKGYDISIKSYVEKILVPKPSDILIVAGDLGHYNHQNIDVLNELKNHYGNIVITSGNHEMYLVSSNQMKKYQWNFKNRLQELKQLCYENDIVVLDGTTTEINNVIIGGCSLWYNIPDTESMRLWTDYYNDSRLITEAYPFSMAYTSRKITTFNSNKYYKEEVEKMEGIGKCDIFVSHVLPIIQPYTSSYDPDYDIFYYSDTEHVLDKLGAKHCVYGHSHEARIFDHGGKTFYNSAIGYPSEQTYTEISVFEV